MDLGWACFSLWKLLVNKRGLLVCSVSVRFFQFVWSAFVSLACSVSVRFFQFARSAFVSFSLFGQLSFLLVCLVSVCSFQFVWSAFVSFSLFGQRSFLLVFFGQHLFLLVCSVSFYSFFKFVRLRFDPLVCSISVRFFQFVWLAFVSFSLFVQGSFLLVCLVSFRFFQFVRSAFVPFKITLFHKFSFRI